MRRIVALGCLVVTSVALAAPLQETPAEVVKKTAGLVIAEASKPGLCAGEQDGWADPAVDAWRAAHPVTAVRVPWTKSNIEALVGTGLKANELRFAFRDGQELDRACGCMTGPELVGWLDVVAAGKTRAGALREALLARTEGPYPVDRWLEVVQLDFCANRLDDAFATTKQLWDDIPTKAPERRDVRLSRLVRDMGVLARRHAPAEAGLAAMRDALDAKKDTDGAALDEWVALNRVLLQDDRTFAWFDANKADPAKKALVDRLAPNVFWMLAEAGKWPEAGNVVGDPEAWLGIWRKQIGGLDPAVWGYAALSAAGRDADAATLAKGILKGEPTAACKLLAKVTEVGAVRSKQAPLTKKCDDPKVVEAWKAKL